MAKHLRGNGGFENYLSWDTWLEQEGIDQNEVSYWERENRAQAEALRTGEDVLEVLKRIDQKRDDLWQTYQGESEVFRAGNEQQTSIRNNLLDSVCSVFQKADRILSNLPVEVFLNDETEQDAPAWNDGKNVTFNAKRISAVNEDTVASLHGLNYHELSHLLFTPRAGTALGKWVMERKTITHENTWKDWQDQEHTSSWEEVALTEPRRSIAFNILEDCRAEYFMTQRYPSTRPFFISLLGEYLIKNPADLGINFILLAGRKYFSLAGRQASARAYSEQFGEEQAKLVYSICSEYRTLVYPRDYTRGMELIEQLITILPEELLKSPSGCTGRPVMRNGKPLSEKEQVEIVGADTEQDEIKFGGVGYTEGGKPNDEGEFNAETSHFNTDKDTNALESIERAVERAKDNSAFRSKVRDTIKAITKDGSTKTILTKTAGTPEPPTQAEIIASRLFGQELERIRIECDPAWEQERPTGKLNVRRAMNADVNEVNKLFDRWTIGNEDYDIEACIAIDKSGSMYYEIGSASRSAWVIKRAIEKINGRVSVMTFNHESRMLYEGDEKANALSAKIVNSSGGTNPYYSVVESKRIFDQSKAKTKLFFLLTDGAFSGESDGLIKAMNQDGVFTSVVFLGNGGWVEEMLKNPKKIAEFAHGAKNFRAIAKPIDLVKVAKDVVKHSIKAGK